MTIFRQTTPDDYEPVSIPTVDDLPEFTDEGNYACMATIPRRTDNVAVTIETIYDQFDHIFLYLNEFDSVPAFMDDPKITAFQSQDFIDLNATGKVFFASMIDKGRIFTLDDDMLFPQNYVARMSEAMAKFDDKVAVCVHGSILPPNPEYYYLRTEMYVTQGPLRHQRFVNLPGSGVFAWPAGLFPVELESFMPETMVDLTFGILCKDHGVPIVSIDRPEFWVQNTDREGLFQAFRAQVTHHSHYAKAQGPWAFGEIAPRIVDLAADLDEDDPSFDWDAIHAARAGEVPKNWSTGASYYRRHAEYMLRYPTDDDA